MIKLIILVSLAAIANGQYLGFGPCPAAMISQTYDLNRLSGVWYENQRVATSFDTGKCVKHTLVNLFDYGFVVSTSTTTIATNSTSNVIGLSVYFDKIGIKSLPGKFALFYPTFPYNQPPSPMPINLLAGSSTSYTIVYACLDLGFAHTKFAWLLTRDRVPTAAILTQAYADLDNSKIDRSLLVAVDQSC